MKIVESYRPWPTSPVESTWIRKGMRTAVLLSMLALGACGQKGPLVLPMVAAPSSDHSTQ